MRLCEIINGGLYTCIVDIGRIGYKYYGVPQSGALDSISYNICNKILGNPVGTPVFEFNFIPPTIEFQHDCLISLTGSNMHIKIDHHLIPQYQLVKVKKGQILSGEKGKENSRTYLGVKGNLSVEKCLGSYSQYKAAGMGHNQGAPLQKENKICFTPTNDTLVHVSDTIYHLPSSIEFSPGPEFNMLSIQSIKNLTQTSFSINSKSNRMGALLDGIPLNSNLTLKQSVPVLPGFLQLLPSGHIIVLLNEGQTTGGYPRIAFLDEHNLSLFCSLPFAKEFRFTLNKHSN